MFNLFFQGSITSAAEDKKQSHAGPLVRLQNGLRDSWKIVITIFHSTSYHRDLEAQIFTFDPGMIRGIDNIPLIVKVEGLWWCTESKRRGGPTVI